MTDRSIVAVVTGSSRGVGAGIADELGRMGATVYVTGRSTRAAGGIDGVPGTVEDTAERVSSVGGRGISVRCDHTREEDVAALAERIRSESGRVDLLVNNAWGGYEGYDPAVWELPFEEQPLWRWDKMFETGVRLHYVTSRHLRPLMTRGSLIVTISAGDDAKFLGDVQYDVAKAAVDRLGFAMARKLKREGIAVVTVHPGFTRTERVKEAAPPEALAATHSTRFVGRCVVALWQDEDRMARTGGAYKAGGLGLDYGFTDVDGSQPPPFSIPDGYGE